MPDPVLAWCDDIHSVRGNVSQLQATLNQIITKTPSVAQYKQLIATYDSPDADAVTEAPSILEKLRSIMHSPQVKVAVRLKSLYDRGFLPFLLGLSRINFRSPKSDRFVGYLLDYSPPKVDNSASFPEEGDFLKGPQQDSENASYPPSLPPIENQSLLRLVLTDRSLRSASDFLESEHSEGFHDFNNNHNRKLALRGRDILHLALTDILDECFPKAHEDDIEFLKLRLSATTLLAKLALSYNFADAIMHQISQDASVDEKLIVFRNVFLAYIGGMSKSAYTFSAIRLWISELFQPLISKIQMDSSKTQLKNPYVLAYAELNFMFRRVNNLTDTPTKRIKYEFRVLSSEDPYVFQLVVANQPLGIGSASTADLAKSKAAYATFEDPESRAQVQEILVNHYRTVHKEKDTVSNKENVSAGEGASEDKPAPTPAPMSDTKPEIHHATNDPRENQKYMPVSVPKINYTEWPAHIAQQIAHNGKIPTAEPKQQAHSQGSTHKPNASPHMTPGQMSQKQTSTPPAPHAQVRMPLPYGMLPPIPNMKKKGGKS